jgi:hypothetical protein
MQLRPRHLGPAALAAAVLALAGAATAFAAGEPVNRGSPVVSQSGNTLSTTDGTWVGATRPFTYAWYRCAGADVASCIAVPGQTASTYTVTGLDAGSRIRSQVTASNPLGSSSAFSGATAAFPVAQPSPATGPTAVPRLSPFPVLVVTGRVRGGHTRITGLLVRGPAGARVSVTCGGRCHARKVTATIGSRRSTRLKKAQRVYRSGAVLDVRVTGRAKIGKFTRLRMRSGRAPARSDRCLAPGAVAPSACS